MNKKRLVKKRTTKRSKQLVFQTIYILKCPSYYTPSIYTTSNTMELNSKRLKDASPTEKKNLVMLLVKPTKPQKIEKQNTTTDEPSHNKATNDPRSPHNNGT